MFEKKAKHFVMKEEESGEPGALQMIADTVTGVHDLVTVGAAVSGITPLPDENDEVVMDKQGVHGAASQTMPMMQQP